MDNSLYILHNKTSFRDGGVLMKTLEKSIAGYLAACEYERKLSPETLKAYRIDLRQFSEFVYGTWPDRDQLCEIGRAHV